MPGLLKVFTVGMQQILRDGMLLVMLPAPFFTAGVLRAMIPIVHSIAVREFGFSLLPYYALVDALTVTIAPVMTAMVSAFVVMEERDEGIASYLCITPAGGRSYLYARVGLPMVWAFTSSLLALGLFGLSGMSISIMMGAAFVGTLQGIVVAMLIVALANNKVEGLALSKLAGLFFIGLPASWFVAPQWRYLAGFLPSFWMSETLRSAGPAVALTVTGSFVSALWIAGLGGVFLRRVGLR